MKTTPEDRALIERMNRDYAAPEMTPIERSRFDRRLDDRIERRRPHVGRSMLTAVTALAAGAVAVVFLSADPAPVSDGEAEGEGVAALQWLSTDVMSTEDEETYDLGSSQTELPADLEVLAMAAVPRALDDEDGEELEEEL